MIQTIRVKTKGRDALAEGLLSDIRHFFKSNVTKIETVKVYRLEAITEKQAATLSEKLLCESLNQAYTLNRPMIKNASVVLEIAYRPGVMNPEASSIMKAANDLGIKMSAADSSREYGFFGKITREEAQTMVQKLTLVNPTIAYLIASPPTTLMIKGKSGPTTTISIRTMTDGELLELSKDKLFLNLEELRTIKNYFQKIKKDPTDCELETIAQTWSEHCAHKTFKAHLFIDGKRKAPLMTRIKNEALKHKKNIVSAFVDNSGVMDFYDGYAICGKVETHNSPSAIEPYGGAMTGSGGVFRDVLGTGKGAKTIVSTDMFCFAPPDMDRKKLPQGCLPPDYLFKRVVTGVKDYGNRMGIPTNNGSVHFHDDFRAKPTVIVGAYGILPKTKAQKGKARAGDVVMVVGGQTGRDGIHGATFSSSEMTERTISVNSSAVQIGNAIEEKRMFDCLLKARDKGYIRAIQDCGAGGFSSAIGEMGEKTGVTIHLEKASLKYPGLSPWEIWVSESQERMVIAISPKKIKTFIALCKIYNVEATALGKFDRSKKLRIYYERRQISNLDMRFLHHGLPQRVLQAKRNFKFQISNFKFPRSPRSEKEWLRIIKKTLSHPNVCSKEPIVRRYDHSVQGTNSLQPFAGEKLDGPNDAVVIRPLLDKPYGMVVAHGLNPILNRTDPYWGSIWAGTEAVSNYVAVGGDIRDASLINNYIWPFPDEESLWSLDQSVDAVVDFMKTLKIPVVSGKDSLSSTYKGKDGSVIKIPPVLCMSVFGKIRNVKQTASSDIKKVGSVLCLVGKLDHQNSPVPRVDLKMLPKTLSAVYKGIVKGVITSCHDVSEGGIITTIFEMCVGGNIGASIIIPSSCSANEFLLNETAGCFVIEVEREKEARQLCKNVPLLVLGKTQKDFILKASYKKITLFEADIDVLKKAWQKPMKQLFE